MNATAESLRPITILAAGLSAQATPQPATTLTKAIGASSAHVALATGPAGVLATGAEPGVPDRRKRLAAGVGARSVIP
ncbi:MAG: hypothetical protein HY553_11520 [Elusimicrobia bacterium]|nr:hypothetical protein [Elusimicrobiota bacterium]